MVTKYEFMTNEEKIYNYERLKNIERARNKKAYEKLQEDPDKYNERLNKVYMNRINTLEDIKEDENRLVKFKEARKLINARAYQKRKNKQFY